MKDENVYAKAEMMLNEYMGMHRMHNSQERWMLLRRVTEICGRFTAKDLEEWASKRFISRATVYNSLDLFEKAHVVHCLHRQHSGRVMEYECALGERASMMIICSKCGRVARVSDKATEVSIRLKKYPNFIMQHYSVYVFGECKECKKLLPPENS